MAQALLALILGFALAAPAAAAQVKADAKKSAGPAWSELKPAQQQILAPLAPEWAKLDAARRKKWIEIADRYPKMKPQEQQRLQKRMADWAKLTPAQRAAARDKYQALKKLPPDKRKEVTAQWQRYQRSLAQQPHFSPSDPPAPPDDPQATEPPTAVATPEPSGEKPPGTATAATPTPAAH
jgi:hypothetical protein